MKSHFVRLLSLTGIALLTAPAALAQENHPPYCNDGGTITVACQGATTTVTLTTDASDPDNDPLSYQWLSCPGSFLTDPTAPVTDLVLNTLDTCNVQCGVRLRLTDPSGDQYVCRLYVQVVTGADGCSPGYWKNHPASWPQTGFHTTDDYDTVFGFDAFTPNKTLLQALQTGGGGKNKLGRMSVAALLNAADPDVHFPMSIGDVLDVVHDALASGQYEPLAGQLDILNNLGCPQD